VDGNIGEPHRPPGCRDGLSRFKSSTFWSQRRHLLPQPFTDYTAEDSGARLDELRASYTSPQLAIKQMARAEKAEAISRHGGHGAQPDPGVTASVPMITKAVWRRSPDLR